MLSVLALVSSVVACLSVLLIAWITIGILAPPMFVLGVKLQCVWSVDSEMLRLEPHLAERLRWTFGKTHFTKESTYLHHCLWC